MATSFYYVVATIDSFTFVSSATSSLFSPRYMTWHQSSKLPMKRKCVLVRLALSSDAAVAFPKELYSYGLNEALLEIVFQQVQSGKASLKWCLQGVPNRSFYHKLHEFLKKWPTTRHTTKVAIGTFYLAIDKNLRDEGGRPDNIYRFIERVASATEPDELMTYNVGVTELKAMRAEVKHCTGHVSTLSCQVSELK